MKGKSFDYFKKVCRNSFFKMIFVLNLNIFNYKLYFCISCFNSTIEILLVCDFQITYNVLETYN